MTCAQIAERNLLVDALYGELAASKRTQDRRALEAHIAGCAACRQEMAALERTLGQARSALAGPLAEEPPARVRVEVMRQAVAAVAGGSGAGVAEARAAAAAPVESFWAWLRRKPWLGPSVMAAAAMLVFVVAKKAIIDDPRMAFEGSRATDIDGVPRDEAPAMASAPRAPEPAAAAKSDELAKQEEPAARAAAAPPPPSSSDGVARPRPARRRAVAGLAPAEPDQDLGRRKHEGGGKGVGEARLERSAAVEANRGGGPLAEQTGHRQRDRRWAVPPPAATPPPAEAKKKAAAEDAVAGLADDKAYAAPGQAPRDERDERDERLANAPASPGVPASASGASVAAASEPPASAGAAPAGAAPASAAPAPSPMPVPARQSLSAPEAEEETEAEIVSEARKPAQRVPLPKAAAQGGRAAAAPAKEAQQAPQQTRQQAGQASYVQLLARAERLYTERRWAEAEEAYRELLRRYPERPEARTWKRRVDTVRALKVNTR